VLAGLFSVLEKHFSSTFDMNVFVDQYAHNTRHAMLTSQKPCVAIFSIFCDRREQKIEKICDFEEKFAIMERIWTKIKL